MMHDTKISLKEPFSFSLPYFPFSALYKPLDIIPVPYKDKDCNKDSSKQFFSAIKE